MDNTWAKFSVLRLPINFSFVAFVFPWERWFIGLLVFLFVNFFIESQIIFGLVLEFIFEVKVLQENFLAFLMLCQVLVLCCLYLFRFSDESFVWNFMRVAYVFLRFCTLLWTTVYYGFGDSFIGYGDGGVGKMYCEFFLVCIWFWDQCGKA